MGDSQETTSLQFQQPMLQVLILQHHIAMVGTVPTWVHSDDKQSVTDYSVTKKA